jgi:hypothetical protein
MDNNQKDQAMEIVQQRDASRDWMRDAYWPEWERVYRSYKCQMEERKDSKGKIDRSRSAIAQPDTFALVNRRAARVTAQRPDVGFLSSTGDEAIDRMVSLKVMHDWDEGSVQRWQPKHVRQAELMGWSVRGWYWDSAVFNRKKGIDISRPLTPEELGLIAKTYKVENVDLLMNPGTQQKVLNTLLETSGRRGLLDVAYEYKAYEGPRSEVLFVGDCYPEQFFDTIQTSNWFIVQQNRKRDWFMRMGQRFPQMAAGIDEMFKMHPRGTDMTSSASEEGFQLKEQLRAAIGKPTQANNYATSRSGSQVWTVIAKWTPGENSKVSYVAQGGIWLGEIENPYSIDGKIPFTELILIDDILGGVGDSVARVTRGLQQMHDLVTNHRYDLYRMVTQPTYATSDRTVYDNPEILSRDGFSLVHVRSGPGSIWALNDSQAMSAMAQAMNEEGAIQRMFQMASGDSNMSMSANVDPAQLRTATGARMLQANQDVLTKALVDMFEQTSVRSDVEMVYLLNRSEMGDAIPIDASRYERNYNPNVSKKKSEWINIENTAFQVDGKLTVRLGSTLADDDEANVGKATNLFERLAGNPYANQKELVKDLLIAHGKGPKISEYLQDPPPQPQEPPIKGSMSVRMDLEKESEPTKRAVLAAAGVTPDQVAQMEQLVGQEQEAAAMGMPPGAAMAPQEMGPPPGVDPAAIAAAEMGVQ